MYKRVWLIFLCLLLLLMAEDAEYKYQQLQQKYHNLYEAYHKKTFVQRMKLVPPSELMWQEFQQLIDDFPGSEGARKSLFWMVRNWSGCSPSIEEQHKVLLKNLDTLITYYVNHPDLVEVLSLCKYVDLRICRDFFEKVIEKTTTKSVREDALYYYACTLYDSEISRNVIYSKKLFQQLSKHKNNYQQKSKNFLSKLERRQTGMVAPEIVGKDVDGNEMRLSDFRGNVVFLYFWGHW